MARQWRQIRLGRQRLGDIPFTAFLCLAFVVTFFTSAIWHGGDPLNKLVFLTGEVSHVWTLLTWPIYCTAHPIFALFAVAWCFSICGSLERSWSTSLFARFFVGSSIFTALLLYGISFLLHQPTYLSGLWVSLAPPTVAWGLINRRETVMLYCVLPVPAMWLALLVVVVAWYDVGPPLLGLSVVGTCALTYWYVAVARDTQFNVKSFAAVQTHKYIAPRQQHGEDLPNTGITLSPSKWLKERQERKRLDKLFGGSDFTDKKQ